MAVKSKFITSDRFELLDVEKQKLLRSLLWGILAVVAMALATYLEQYGLPEQAAFVAPLLPVIINLLNKWAGEHKYKV